MQRILFVSVAAAAVALVGSSALAQSKVTVTPRAPGYEWYGNPGPVRNASGQCWKPNSTGNGRDVLNGYWGDCPAPAPRRLIAAQGEWYGNPGPVRNASGQCWKPNSTGNGRDVLNGYWGDCPAPAARRPVTPVAEWYGNPGPVRRGDMCWKANGTGNGRDVLNGYWTACPKG